MFFFFFNDTATTEIYTLSLHDALPISNPYAMIMSGQMLLAWLGRKHNEPRAIAAAGLVQAAVDKIVTEGKTVTRSEEHTSELQSRQYLACRPLPVKTKE